MSYREELIQIAAVCVSIIEDMDYGIAEARRDVLSLNVDDLPTIGQAERVVYDVIQERLRQDAKWGPQSHTEGEWLAILAEEIGEAAREVDVGDNIGLISMKGQLVWAEHNARYYLKRKGLDG